jgi:UDP-N-acetylmuramoyl-L-alanyl-D-glutamate--2,6-diaminopimelate ligase
LAVDDPRLALALSAARYFGKQPQTMVAVTGTSGKTSVAAFTRQIWEQAGYAAASIGTTGVVAPGRNDYGSLTTPDPVALHQLLRELADAGVTHASMEASSHGLDQRRLDGVKLAAGGFTNLGRDHMDYHPTVEDYHRAKLRLFDTLLPKGAPAVIFADDPWSQPTIEAARAAGLEVLTVGRRGEFLKLKRVEHERHRQRAEVEADGVLHEIDLPLAGDFQIANALVSAGLAISTGTSVDKALIALEKLKGAPGRLDLVGTTANGAPVYVDYAHKPDALENMLASVRPFTTGRVIVVFGCGGDRDRGKRPIMGEIATRLADVVIVTDDNPRSEAPEAIRAAILAAAPGAIEIGDRRKAIHEAVAMLHAGDTLIVAGKGHEVGQTVGTETVHFSDHEEVRSALRERAA